MPKISDLTAASTLGTTETLPVVQSSTTKKATLAQMIASVFTNAGANVLAVLNGGTGATTAAGARTNLGATVTGSALFTAVDATAARTAAGAAASGANTDITSLASLSTPLSIAQGGTAANTAALARTSLGATAVGAALFTAVDAPAARTAAGFTAAVIDRVYVEYTTNADLTGTIPFDDTIPQVTEGVQFLSAAITPKSTSSRIRVRLQCVWQCASAQNQGFAVFRNGAANAIRANFTTNSAAGFATMHVLEFEDTPSSTSAQTYTVRTGNNGGVIIRINGTTSARVYGGVMAATLILEEIL